MSFAQATIGGRLGKDPDLREGARSPMGLFSIGVDTGWGDRKRTSWWNCSIFGKKAEVVAKNFRRGDPIIVYGTPYENEYVSRKDGLPRKSLSLDCNDFAFPDRSSSRRDEQASVPRGPSVPQAVVEDDDSIPF